MKNENCKYQRAVTKCAWERVQLTIKYTGLHILPTVYTIMKTWYVLSIVNFHPAHCKAFVVWESQYKQRLCWEMFFFICRHIYRILIFVWQPPFPYYPCQCDPKILSSATDRSSVGFCNAVFFIYRYIDAIATSLCSMTMWYQLS